MIEYDGEYQMVMMKYMFENTIWLSTQTMKNIILLQLNMLENTK